MMAVERLVHALALVVTGSMPIMYASERSAPGPTPSIARPRVMWSSMHEAVGDHQRVVVAAGS